jgi:hypothetical protein
MTKQTFPAGRFIATEHSTADEKARFCACFVKFVLGGFARSMFKAQLYRRLSQIFGFIAHYDETGFYEVWFSAPEKQRHFIRCIFERVPVGDPKFCWSDAERELKSWAVMNAEAIEAIIAENERKYVEAAKAESKRRAALRNRSRQRFTVAAKSINTNAFGHRQYVLVADDGSAFKVQRSYAHPWDVGQIVTVPLATGEPNWAAVGCECPERIENCPVEA